MGIASIGLGVLALILMFLGFVLAWVPVLGTVLSFSAPVVAIAGIVLGGLGLSRAKRDGQPTGAPVGGLVVSIVAFIPALFVAVTCGLCNACMTAGMMAPGGGFQIYDGGGSPSYDPNTVPGRDGGPFQVNPFDPGLPPPDPNAPPLDPNAPPAPPPDPGAPPGPPPAFPPPPIQGGAAPAPGTQPAPGPAAPPAAP